MAAKILTKADEAAIREMPDDWFSAWSLTYVKNPRYRCERLEAAGVLETRVVGAFPDLTTEFRKVPSPFAAGPESEANEVERRVRAPVATEKEQ